MHERMRVAIRLNDGETVTLLCREFGILGKTGYKIFERYQECEIEGLMDRTRRPKRPRTRAAGTPLPEGHHPDDLWCTDYKGEFLLGDKRHCDPLTGTDHASCYLPLCEALTRAPARAQHGHQDADGMERSCITSWTENGAQVTPMKHLLSKHLSVRQISRFRNYMHGKWQYIIGFAHWIGKSKSVRSRKVADGHHVPHEARGEM